MQVKQYTSNTQAVQEYKEHFTHTHTRTFFAPSKEEITTGHFCPFSDEQLLF